MRKLFFLSLISAFLSPIQAEIICTLISEKEPDVTIDMNYPSGGYGYGTMRIPISLQKNQNRLIINQ